MVRTLCGTPDTERMWGELSTTLLVGLALVFYAIVEALSTAPSAATSLHLQLIRCDGESSVGSLH